MKVLWWFFGSWALLTIHFLNVQYFRKTYQKYTAIVIRINFNFPSFMFSFQIAYNWVRSVYSTWNLSAFLSWGGVRLKLGFMYAWIYRHVTQRPVDWAREKNVQEPEFRDNCVDRKRYSKEFLRCSKRIQYIPAQSVKDFR